jgi:hypothetical protein
VAPAPGEVIINKYKKYKKYSYKQKQITSVKTKTRDRPIIPAGMTPTRLKKVNVKEANIWSGVPEGARNQD